MDIAYTVTIIFLVLVGVFVVSISVNNEKESPVLFQGPVPEGYDEDVYRKTGVTELKESDTHDQ